MYCSHIPERILHPATTRDRPPGRAHIITSTSLDAGKRAGISTTMSSTTPNAGGSQSLHKLLIAYRTVSHESASALHMLSIAYRTASHKPLKIRYGTASHKPDANKIWNYVPLH